MKPPEAVFQRGLDDPPENIRFFFLYGADESASRAQAERLVRTLGPEVDRIALSSHQLRDDAGALDGAAHSQSLFGGNSAVILQIDDIDPAMKAIERLIDADDRINLVIGITGALPGTNKLVKYASSHPKIWVHANYPLDQKSGAQVADLICRSFGLRVVPGVAQRLFEASNGDRDILASEVGKLSLFLDSAPERPRELIHEHLDKLVAELSAEDTSGLVDAILGGRPNLAMNVIAELDSAGVDAIVWIRALGRRTQLLLQLSEQVETGKSVNMAMDSAKVFFKEKPQVERQFHLWPRPRLERLVTRLVEAERLSKSGRHHAHEEIRALLLQISRLAERAAR